VRGKFLRFGVSASVLAVAVTWPAHAQDQSAAPQPQPQPQAAGTAAAGAQAAVAPTGAAPAAPDIVVTGFRRSLDNALALKKKDAGVVDTILAEDIGKFPDSNLAESMQRVPGVALARGDGGEGRQITVRGLPPIFTRVLVDGMEANSQVGETDINNTAGGSSRSRAFDFSAYPSEIFSSLTVRKSSSADMEEGSLGATVELRAPRPFDYRQDFILTASAKASYGDLSHSAGPRLSALVSKKFADGTLGVLVGTAYTERDTRDEGYAPSSIVTAATDGGFCSPIGYARQNPATTATNGASATMCGTGVPRTSTNAAYSAITNGNVFLPRLPRYERSDQHYSRLGLTGSIQWKPDDNTEVSLDGIYTRYKVKREDYYLMGLSFGRNDSQQGKPETSVVDAHVKPDGTLDYGVFNGVDVVSQTYQNNYTTELKQGTLNFRHNFSDTFEIDGQAGYNESTLREPVRANVIIYANNVNGFTFDIRNSDFAKIGYGFDVADPNNYVFSPNTAPDGTITSQATANRGGSTTRDTLGELGAKWSPFDGLKIRFGGQYRESDFKAFDEARNSSVNPALPAGTTLASITKNIHGFGQGLPSGPPASWTAIDWGKFVSTYDFFNNPAFAFQGPAQGQDLGNNYAINEKEKSAYVQAEFEHYFGSIRVRGNAGVRYVRTDQSSFGYVSGVGVVPITIKRHYDDWLPSLNLAADITSKLTLRVAAAKVMARPDLPQLSPGTSIAPPTHSANVGNPFLDPTRAKTVDVSAEWYFAQGSLLSAGFFYKDIDSYTQSIVQNIPFSQTGLPASLLDGQRVSPDDLFAVTTRVNTPGGPLRGIELNYQQQLRFLPSFLKNLGILVNFTHVTSNINYILNPTTGNTASFPLIGLSKDQVNATLYYEDKRLSLRGSVNYRSKSLRAVPSIETSGFSDVDLVAPTTYVDFSAGYSLTDQWKLTFDASNLTDEHTVYYVDSKRKDVLYNIHSGRTFEAGVSFKF